MRRLRELIKGYLGALVAPLARQLDGAGISANQITVAGFLVAIAGALLVGAGWFVLGGLVFLSASLFDLLDGVLAREQERESDFGAFLDSSLDRVAEGLLFSGLAYRFAANDDPWLAALSVLALLGAFLTSYTRARAEGLGYECDVGLITRGERVLIIGIGLVAGVAAPAVWVLVFLGGFTAAQRIVYVWRQASAGSGDHPVDE